MTREFDFVLAAVRQFFQPEAPLPSTDGLDWNAVAEIAERHAVTGFLRRAYEIPSLDAYGAEAARANLALSAELIKLAEGFTKQGIDILPLKGPVLGAALYKGEVLKASSDLDLLVRRRDALNSKRILEGVGYCLMTVPHWQSDKACLRNINDELSFRDSGRWLKLDLHWNLLPGYFPSPLSEEELWAGAQSTPWGKTNIRTLSSEHQLLFLCAHGAKHLWGRLGWICDLAQLVRVRPEIDWIAVLDQARRSQTTRITLLGLRLVNELFAIELPASVVKQATTDPQVRALAANVVQHLRAFRQPSHVALAAFCERATESPAQRARLLFGMFAQPTEAEYQVLQLPPSLYWSYYIFRPLRLLTKHSRRRNRSRDGRELQAKKA